jgi:ribosome-associated protein
MMEEPKSKSQKKREADALQKIGVQLISLSMDKLNALPMSDNLRRAIVEAKSLRSHGAVRRQAQLIGKLMRTDESEELLNAYAQLQADDSAQTAAFHEVEQWRERLIAEGNAALTEFISQYQPEDVQQLRQLIKKAVREHETQQSTGASRALFRFVRACLE